MTTKHFKTYCRIFDYIEAVDPALTTLIRGTCTEVALLPAKNCPGITFLWPQDTAFRARLEKLAYSDKPEEASSAADMIRALIIRDVLKTTNDWSSKKDDIPNSLFPAQHVEVASSAASGITFASGAKAVLDTAFKDSSRKNNLAVWKLMTGEIPVTTNKPAQLKYARRAKTGGYTPTNEHARKMRYKIGIAIENAYAAEQISGSEHGANAFMRASLSLAQFVLDSDRDLFIDNVLPQIALCEMDFYYLVEPHRACGNYLLGDNIISDWWAARANSKKSPAETIKNIESALDAASSDALIYSKRSAVLDAIMEIRQALMPLISAKPREIVTEICKCYDALESSNTIGTLSPIYPAATAAYYAANCGLKMVQDELRYYAHSAFKRFGAGAAFDIGGFHEMVNLIGECLYAPTPEERAKTQKLLNKNVIKCAIAPTERVQDVKIFLYSTMFLQIPLTCADADSLKVKNTVTKPDPSNVIMFNIAKDLYSQHERILNHADAAGASDLVAMLMSLDVNTLDSALKAALEKKFGPK